MNVVCLRMAVRSLIRNRTQAVLTLLGAAIGTALITSSLLLLHSFKLSQQDVLYEQLGSIIVDVKASDQMHLHKGYFSRVDITEMRQAHHRQFDESNPLQLLGTISLETTLMSEDGRRYSPRTYVQGFELEQAEAIDPQAVQALPRSMRPGEMVLSEFAGQKLGVQPGDPIYVMDAMGQWQRFVVKDIITPQGLTGYRGAELARTTAIISDASARALAGIPPEQFTNVLFFNEDSSSINARYLPLPLDQWEFRLVRFHLENRLSKASDLLPIFLIAGIHAILIAAVLITNVFSMMAEQRKQEWAVLRAIGFTRNHLRSLFHYETLIYALVSGIAGCLGGAGLAYVWFRELGALFQTMLEYEEGIIMSFRFTMHPGLMLVGFLTGSLLIWFCNSLVARKITRSSIAASLQMRQQMKPTLNRRSTLFSQVKGPLILIATMSLILLMVADPYHDRIVLSELAPIWYFLLGILLISFSIAAVMTGYRQLMNGWLKLLAFHGPLSAALKLALRYPQAQLSRTGWVMLMFALILFLTGFSAVFSQTISQFFGSYQSRIATGGFDLIAELNNEKSISEIESYLAEYDPALPSSLETIITIPQVRMYYGELAIGMNRQYADHITIPLRLRDSAYADDRATWQALTKDPEVIVASEHFLNRQSVSYALGDRIRLDVGDTKIELRLIGIAEYSNENYGYPVASGVWVHPDVLERLASRTSAVSGLIGFKLHSDEPGTATARALEQALIPYGMVTLLNPKEKFAANSLFIQVFFSLFERFSLVTSMIGIAGLMIIMMRIMQERRQEMGMLRAIGIPSRLIFGSLLGEAAMIGVTGMLCGLGIGVFIGYRMIHAISVSEGSQVVTLFPISKLVIYLLVTVAATILSLLLPARIMMKQTPAEATRHAGN